MTVNLSIKGVPDDVAQRLRERAQRHHRSLQGELMAIVEAAAAGEALAVQAPASPVYRPSPTPDVQSAETAETILDGIDADLQGAGLAGGPWLPREAVHDRILQREAAAAPAAPGESARRVRKRSGSQ